jgi:hypothetical protein
LPSFSFAFLPILCTPKSLNQIKILSNNLPSLPRPLVEKAKYEGQNSGGVGVGKMGEKAGVLGLDSFTLLHCWTLTLLLMPKRELCAPLSGQCNLKANTRFQWMGLKLFLPCPHWECRCGILNE